jgi:hypothetical protein
MVGHQAVRPHVDRRLAAALGEEIPIERMVPFGDEDRLATIAALRDVVG